MRPGAADGIVCSQHAGLDEDLHATYSNPMESLGTCLTDDAGSDLPMNFDHGTTTLGFKYKGGVILACDSRATGGAYIGSGTVKKIIPINKFLLGTMAGGAADCTYWERVLSKQCALRAQEQGEDFRGRCLKASLQ